MELASLFVLRIAPSPGKGLSASGAMFGLANVVPGASWLMLASCCKCKPRRPTYATSTVVWKPTSRCRAAFHVHASGLKKTGSCVVTGRGNELLVAPLPGLSTEPCETDALGWN